MEGGGQQLSPPQDRLHASKVKHRTTPSVIYAVACTEDSTHDNALLLESHFLFSRKEYNYNVQVLALGRRSYCC